MTHTKSIKNLYLLAFVAVATVSWLDASPVKLARRDEGEILLGLGGEELEAIGEKLNEDNHSIAHDSEQVHDHMTNSNSSQSLYPQFQPFQLGYRNDQGKQVPVLQHRLGTVRNPVTGYTMYLVDGVVRTPYQYREAMSFNMRRERQMHLFDVEALHGVRTGDDGAGRSRYEYGRPLGTNLDRFVALPSSQASDRESFHFK